MGCYSNAILGMLNAHNMHLVPRDVLETLINDLPEKTFSVYLVHDCFGTHANYCEDIKKLYLTIMNRLSHSKIYRCFLEDACGDFLNNPSSARASNLDLGIRILTLSK
ncbi:hypothetical protein TAO_1421 [Candidatus Nitrosoglobus terrae]|uniref:DNA-directed RNA polymerase n=1 Tax=Candidatus Nitrosoglobus terrae TaxID=1630141 RepID=A0A1Q2SNU6_9GAMM|nr:hypothetical protein TAO_1421 [Candidatus Nitrosoglobus terrae]